MHHPTDRITHTTTFVTPVVEYWLEREIAHEARPLYGLITIDTNVLSGRKDRNVLFNDTHNTFYLRLLGVRHMVTDHSAREETHCRHYIGYSFRLAARVLLYASSHIQDNPYHGLCYTSRGALAGTRNS